MTLSKPAKILIGLATAWVVLYPFLFFFFWLVTVFGMIGLSSLGSNQGPPVFLFPIFAIFPLHFLTIFAIFILDAVYLIHVIRNTAASETIRILLGLGIFFLPFVAFPLYYYLYIWLDQPPAWALATPPNPIQSSPGPGSDNP